MTGGGRRRFHGIPTRRYVRCRNLSGLYSHRGRLYSPFGVAGDGRLLEEQEGVIHHLDLVWRDRAARDAKVAGYRGHNAPSCEEYYLYEDYQPLPGQTVELFAGVRVCRRPRLV